MGGDGGGSPIDPASMPNAWDVLAGLPVGTVLWYTSTYPDGVTARPEQAMVVGQPPAPPTSERVAVKYSGLRVRKAPSTNPANVVAALDAGTVLMVSGSYAADGVLWVKITSGTWAGRYVANSQGDKVFLTAV